MILNQRTCDLNVYVKKAAVSFLINKGKEVTTVNAIASTSVQS